MDRLFGKELSNLINPSIQNRQRNFARFHSKSSRGLQVNEPIKHAQKRANKSTICQNQSLKDTKKEENVAVQQKNVQLVPQYFDECFGYMLQQEEKNYNLSDYISSQPEINEKMRGILLDWLADLHYKFKMFPETLFTVTMILDKYLSKKSATKQNLQLIGTAAFYIAAKYQQTYQVPELDDLVHFSAKSFTRQDIVSMEANIIQALNFDLIMITSYRFFQALAKISKMDDKNTHLAQYVLELSLLQTRFLAYNPSLLASSTIYLINKIRKRAEAWPDLLLAATNYQEKQLKSCARQLCYLLQRAQDLPNTKSLKKKFSTAQYHEVTRVRLQRKSQKN